MPSRVRRDDLGERFTLRREMFEHEQERNHPVIRIEVLAEVIVTTHLTREQTILAPHAVLHERVTTLRDDRPAALPLYGVERGPYHAWIEDDRVVTSILRQQDISQQRSDVRARDELTLFSKKHRA